MWFGWPVSMRAVTQMLPKLSISQPRMPSTTIGLVAALISAWTSSLWVGPFGKLAPLTNWPS
jgi:hypothetical protein